MNCTFGSRVRQIRKSQTMSQQDLAARVCITVTYLDKIERGICSPSCRTITGLACALGVDWDELYALAGKVPFDIIHMLVRSPLLVQLVRLGSDWSDEQVRMVLRQNGVAESKLHFTTPFQTQAESNVVCRSQWHPMAPAAPRVFLLANGLLPLSPLEPPGLLEANASSVARFGAQTTGPPQASDWRLYGFAEHQEHTCAWCARF